ncbi:MAG: deoxyribodipyrimidine photo-lyase, partial [Ignavibacteriales bacterium]|nr:deoxyribodipyrimidine photo-lyase [Ignavibacteriales bacterium]
MNPSRVRQIHSGSNIEGPIVYWMSRDQRAEDNWALLYAQECAITRRQPLAVVFCLFPSYLEATLRQYDFMLKGLQEVEKKLQERNISFHLLQGEPGRVLPEFLRSINASQLVTDFSPLRI